MKDKQYSLGGGGGGESRFEVDQSTIGLSSLHLSRLSKYKKKYAAAIGRQLIFTMFMHVKESKLSWLVHEFSWPLHDHFKTEFDDWIRHMNNNRNNHNRNWIFLLQKLAVSSILHALFQVWKMKIPYQEFSTTFPGQTNTVYTHFSVSHSVQKLVTTSVLQGLWSFSLFTESTASCRFSLCFISEAIS